MTEFPQDREEFRPPFLEAGAVDKAHLHPSDIERLTNELRAVVSGLSASKHIIPRMGSIETIGFFEKRMKVPARPPRPPLENERTKERTIGETVGEAFSTGTGW